MKKTFIISLIILIGCEQPINQSTISYENETILVGKITLDGLLSDATFSEWYNYFYENAEINTQQLDLIDDELEDIDIQIFLGTWCSDSQEQVPPFMRIMRYLNYDLESIEMIALEKLEDRSLVNLDGKKPDEGITHVPTFIFYRNGKEVGRIVEFPEVTLEQDMAGIISSS